jgi:hypothetical protein
MPSVDVLRKMCKNLVSSLNNSHCVLQSLGWKGLVHGALEPAGWEDNMPRRKIMHATYSACFKWLTLPRSDEALMDLCRSQCSCTPSQIQSHAHQAGIRMLVAALATHPFVPLLEHILEPFTLIDSEYDSSQHAGRLHTLPRRRLWPRSITSVLPHGPEGTVRAFVRILATDIPHRSRQKVYVAFRTMLQLCGPLVAPLLIRSSFFARHAISPMRELRLEPESHVEGKLDSPHNFEVMTCIKNFVGLMSDIVCRSTSEAERIAFCGLAPASIMASYAHCIDVYLLAQKLVNAPSTRHHYQKHPPVWLSILDPVIRKLVLVGAKLCDDHPSIGHVKVSVAVKDLLLESLRTSTGTKKVAVRFVLLMQHLEIRQRCGAPGCVTTRADGPLRCCTGCRRVMYCSKACQKAAWRHTIAHRDVCQVIRRLCLAIELPEQGIVDFVKSGELVKGEMLWIDPTHQGLYHQVLDHFAKLTSFELKTSREGMPPI